MIPASLTTLQRGQREGGDENYILYRVVCPLGVLKFMAISGTFSSLMATKVPSGPTLASAHESLVWRASIFPGSQPTEALTGQASPAGHPGTNAPSRGSRLSGAGKGGTGGGFWSPTRFAVLPTHT